MPYEFHDHLHNFAVWTAARAVQRSFTKTKAIKNAIDSTHLKSLINEPQEFTPVSFDQFHRKVANQIISTLIQNDVSLQEKATYGRAAKIIAIYIKTIAVIRDNGNSNLAFFAHPPIDEIILKNIHKDFRAFKLNKITWTKLTEMEYFSLIDILRTILSESNDAFWILEKYWTPVKD